MDPIILAALITAGGYVVGLVLTAFLTYKLALKAERQRILLELAERIKQGEEAEKKIEVGTWEEIEKLVRARKKVAEAGPGFVGYALILVLVVIIVIAILMVLGPQIGNVFSRITVVPQ